MNERLNLEQAVQFVLSPGSDSELSELSDIDDDEEDEIIPFLREKKPMNCKYYIHFVVFRLQFCLNFISAVLPIFCGVSHPEVQF